MTKELRCKLHYDEFKKKNAELQQEYSRRFADARDNGTPDDILEVNYWHTEEEGKLEDWLIQGFLEIAQGKEQNNG